MEKSREIPIDLGVGNGFIYSKSSSFGPASFPERTKEFYLAQQFMLGMKAAVTPIGASTFKGRQSFSSTENSRPRFNACVNQILKGFVYPYGITMRDDNTLTTAYITPYSALPWPLSAYRTYVESAKLGSTVWTAASAAQRRAWWSMQPRYEGRVDLLNFIFELKDFRDVAKLASKVDYATLSSNAKLLRGYMNKASRDLNIDVRGLKISDSARIFKGLDATTRGLASAFLTKKLAIDPLVKDVLLIHKQMAVAADQAQRAFQQRGSEPNRSHYTEVLFKDTTVDALSYRYNYYWRELKKETSAKFTATMEYTYSYKRRPPLSAFRKYWGLDLNAEVVWNALPLSFLLDYVVGVADSLHAMEKDPNVDLTLMQYCESILHECKAGYFTRSDPRTYWLIINGQMTAGDRADIPLTGYTSTFYERRLATPDRGPALPKFGLPTQGQNRILLALLRCWI